MHIVRGVWVRWSDGVTYVPLRVSLNVLMYPDTCGYRVRSVCEGGTVEAVSLGGVRDRGGFGCWVGCKLRWRCGNGWCCATGVGEVRGGEGWEGRGSWIMRDGAVW